MQWILPAIIVLFPLVLWPQSKSSGPNTDLEVEPLKTTITVWGKLESPTTAYITEFSTDSLDSRTGVNIDDRLRDIPGFTLFRRSSSLAAHPTSQGISLRGLGSSAASRTLVLYDGLPLNDPFGGWVYWSRVNPDAIESVEVSRGASTSAFGDRAMGGVVSLLTPAPSARHFSSAFETGDAGIADVRGGYSDLFGKLGVAGSVRAFRSDGYFVVSEQDRGIVDREADVDFVVGDLRLDLFRDRDHTTFRSNILTERRQNGTSLRENSSSVGTAGVHYQRDSLSATLYHSRGVLRSTFSAVSDARDAENLVLLQKVTSEDTGGSLVWNRSSRAWNLMAGVDTHRAEGLSHDTVVFNGFQRRPGGTLWQQGTFVQTDAGIGGRARIYGGLRHDFTDRGNSFWSPRAGISVSDGPRRWRASIYRSFRAPTLNEFFRQFRVGNVTTLNNTALEPETAIGGEAGMDWRRPSVLFRVTLFWQSVDDLIGNATLRLDPAPLRQRRNLGSGKARGFEVNVQKMLGPLRTEAAYLFADSQLNNAWMPQVPRHQGSFQLLYSSGKMLWSAGVRSYDSQFEDDLNRFLLPGFATVQLMVKRRLGQGVSAQLAVENLFDRTFLVGFVPTPTIGNPRLLRIGLRWESGS